MLAKVRFNPALSAICLLYLIMSCIFGTMNLDQDEFAFIREPYELLGGDYTAGYLKQQKYGEAAEVALKSYYFYWKYRPLFSPIVSPEDQKLFEAQEIEFGYVKPERVPRGDPSSLEKYKKRLVVPEPDRFYTHGAGKPLLVALVSIPQLALTKMFTSGDKDLLYYQYNRNYHPIFVLARVVQILAGLATILLLHWILAREFDRRKAILGAAVVAFFPLSIQYFPNIHHDSILAPFTVATAYFFYKGHYTKAGLLFGLALATKNTALILLLPVILIHVVRTVWQTRDQEEQMKNSIPRHVKGLGTTLLLGLLVLTPFANPVSYANEILTPLTHRITDTRGEEVENFSLATRLSFAPEHDSTADPGPVIRLIQLILHLDDNSAFFIAAAFFLFYARKHVSFENICFLFLLMALPYGLIFGTGFNYRYLVFVPFFAILCAAAAPTNYLIVFVGILLFIDVLYCIDPMSLGGFHLHVD